jgi:hypothetical protein
MSAARMNARRQYPQAYPVAARVRAVGVEGDAKAVEKTLDSVVAAGAAPDGTGRSLMGPHSTIYALYELGVHGHAAEGREIARRALAATRRVSTSANASNETLMMRLNLLTYLGEWKEAASVADSLLTRQSTPYLTSIRGVASVMLGDTADARRRADAVTPDSAGQRAPRNRARILAALGDKAAALDLLRRTSAPANLWDYHDDLVYRFMNGYAPFDEFIKSRD